MKDLKEKHSGLYLFQVLLETLKDFEIDEYITSITRDNASSNNTLIQEFKNYYQTSGFSFEGNIACVAHVLNIVVQDILQVLIKEDYNSLQVSSLIQQEELELEEYEEEEKTILSKLNIILIIYKTNINYYR